MSFSRIALAGLTFEAHQAGDGAGRVIVRDDTAERLGDNAPIAVLIPTNIRHLADWLESVHDACAGKPQPFEPRERETVIVADRYGQRNMPRCRYRGPAGRCLRAEHQDGEHVYE